MNRQAEAKRYQENMLPNSDYDCPGCDYRMSGLQIILALFDSCPRCDEYWLGDFYVVSGGDNEE